MRLERTVIHKVGPFDHFELDLTSTLGPLVALVAPNGTGKSFLCESALAGAAWRKMPTQGRLLARATAADAYIESTIVNGARHILRHTLNANTRKGEAQVLDEHGAALFEDDDASVGKFDDWVKGHLPDREVFFATQFAVQKSEGFIGLGSAARIDIILKATGTARADRISKAASKRAGDTKTELAANRQRIADARESAPELDAAEAELERKRRTLDELRSDAAAARAALDAAEQEAERVAELTRAHGEAVALRERIERELAEARAQLAELGQRHAAADPIAAHDAAAWAELKLTAARAALVDAEVAEREQAGEAERAATRARLEREVGEARALVVELDRRLALGLAFIERAGAIRSAVPRAERLRATIAQGEAELAAVGPEQRRLKAFLADAEKRLEAIQSRIGRAKEVLGMRAVVDAAAAELSKLEADATAAERAHAEAVATFERLQGERVAGAEERIGELRSGLVEIAVASWRAEPHELRESAERTIAEDDAAVAAAARVPAELAAALAARNEAFEAKRLAEQRLRDTKALADRGESIRAAERDLAAAEGEKESLEAQWSLWTQELAAAGERAAAAEAAIGPARAELVEAEALARDAENLTKAEAARGGRLEERARAQATIDRLTAELGALPAPAPPGARVDVAAARAAGAAAEAGARAAAAAVGAAEATRRELEPQVSAVGQRVEALLADLGAAPVVRALPPAPNVDATRAASESAARAESEAAAALARQEAIAEQARAAAAKLAELDAERVRLEERLANWTRLALDFGRDGIQSALVDSAGPELSELANDLLRCHGSRFTLRIETQRAKSDGKGETDECRVMVIDSVAGTEKEAREHSGGECVILGEAVSLALTMMACRRAGVERPTLVRDESGAALDPESARAYVAMLRRAAAFVGADRVLVVSHSREVQDLCDSKIELPARKGS